jgi:hypothetical protein
MAKSTISAIISFGLMFIALGMIPGLIAALMEGLENLVSFFSPLSMRSRSDFPHSTGLWLVVGGGVLVIAGLVAILMR